MDYRIITSLQNRHSEPIRKLGIHRALLGVRESARGAPYHALRIWQPRRARTWSSRRSINDSLGRSGSTSEQVCAREVQWIDLGYRDELLYFDFMAST